MRFCYAAFLIIAACEPESYKEPDRIICFSFNGEGTYKYVAGTLTKEDEKNLSAVETRWFDFSGTTIKFVPQDEPLTNTYSCNLVNQDHSYVGYTMYNSIGVNLSTAALATHINHSASESMQVAMLHEVGHSFGMQHVSPPGIMATPEGSAWDWQYNDTVEWQRIHP